MPRDDGVPPGSLALLILRVLASGPLHGYAIAQRIHQLSRSELSVEEGSLYPALQKLLVKGWVKAAPAISETGRQVQGGTPCPLASSALCFHLRILSWWTPPKASSFSLS